MEKIQIGISRELFEKLQVNIGNFGFNTVDDCIEFVMHEFVQSSNSAELEQNPIDDENQIKKRFRSLGYF
jgi:hypothetical protein